MAPNLSQLLQQIITYLQAYGLQDISARDYLRLREFLDELERDGVIDADA